LNCDNKTIFLTKKYAFMIKKFNGPNGPHGLWHLGPDRLGPQSRPRSIRSGPDH